MSPVLIAEIATGSVIVGVGFILLVAVIMVAAIKRYDVDAVLKLWGGLGALTGLFGGIMATYFFTKDQIEQKDTQLRTARIALQKSENEKAQFGSQVQHLAQGLKMKTFDVLDPEQKQNLARLEDLGKDAQATAITERQHIMRVGSPPPSASP